MSNEALESALNSARLFKEAGGVYEVGQYQRIADGLAARDGLATALLLGGGATALAAALTAASYRNSGGARAEEAVAPEVPLYMGRKRKKPAPVRAAAPTVKAAVDKPWWMVWESDKDWNRLPANSGKPWSQDNGYLFTLPAAAVAIAGGGWLGKKLVDRLYGKAKVQRSADDAAAAEAEFNQAMYDLTKSSASDEGYLRYKSGEVEKRAVSPFSILAPLLAAGGLYGAYKWRDLVGPTPPDPKAEYARALSRYIDRGRYPELLPVFEEEFDPAAGIDPDEETGAGASRSGARPAE